MSKLLFLAIIFTALSSQAKVQVGYGHSITKVNSIDKKFAVDRYNGLQVFYDWSDLSFGIEANYFEKKESHKDLILLSLKYYETIAWARYNFINYNKFKIYFASGVGGYQQKIKFQVANDKVSDTSEPHLLLPASLGASYLFYNKVNVGLELRIIRRIESEYNNNSLRTSLSYLF